MIPFLQMKSRELYADELGLKEADSYKTGFLSNLRQRIAFSGVTPDSGRWNIRQVATWWHLGMRYFHISPLVLPAIQLGVRASAGRQSGATWNARRERKKNERKKGVPYENERGEPTTWVTDWLLEYARRDGILISASLCFYFFPLVSHVNAQRTGESHLRNSRGRASVEHERVVSSRLEGRRI